MWNSPYSDLEVGNVPDTAMDDPAEAAETAYDGYLANTGLPLNVETLRQFVQNILHIHYKLAGDPETAIAKAAEEAADDFFASMQG